MGKIEEMNGIKIGDLVICKDSGAIGTALRFYFPTSCKAQLMVKCQDGREYHAPADEWELLVKESIMQPLTQPLTQPIMQPLLVPHDYRNVKVGENITITIDLEELKEQITKDFYKNVGLMFGA